MEMIDAVGRMNKIVEDGVKERVDEAKAKAKAEAMELLKEQAIPLKPSATRRKRDRIAAEIASGKRVVRDGCPFPRWMI